MIEFDGKNILEMFILSNAKQTDPTTYKILRVFKKHNISELEAIEILIELQAAMTAE